MKRMIGSLMVAMLLVSIEQVVWAGIDQRVEIFPQLGHADMVTSVAFSWDGRLALSGSKDKTLRLWEVATGRELRRFEGHTERVISVAVSPDSRHALSGSEDKTLRLWEIATGKELRRFEGHAAFVNPVAFSPDSRHALSGNNNDDKTFSLWDVATGKVLRRFEGHTDGVRSVAFSPDGRLALSGSRDDTLRLWDVATGKEIRRFEGHAGSVYAVAVSPDSRHALSGSEDKTLRLWEIATGKELRRFEGHAAFVNPVAFSPDGRHALSGSSMLGDTTVRLWDLATGREFRRFEGHGVRTIAISPDSRHALSGSSMLGDNAVRLWDLASGREIRRFEGHTRLVYSVAFSRDGRFALSANSNETLRLWDVATGKELRRFVGHTRAVTSAAFSLDGRFALSSSYDKTIRLWDLATGRELRQIEVDRFFFVTTAALSPDGRFALSGSAVSDSTPRLWDLATGRELRRFVGHTLPVYSVAFSPDGRWALSASFDRTIRLWEVTTGKELRRFEGHENYVNSVAFSPDGRSVLSGSSDRTIRLWEVTTGKELRRFEGHENYVNSVAFSPDGRWALSASFDRTIRLWEVTTGKELRRFEGHTATANSVTFSPDGRHALSGSVDGTMRLWSISTGQEIATFVGFTDGEWLVITPEGYYSASLAGHKHMNARMGNDVYGMDQFYEAFYRPDLVEKKLKREDIASFTAGLNLTEALKNPPPQVTILSPKEGEALRERTVTVKVRIDDRGGGIGDIRLHHNGKLVDSIGVYRLARTETEDPKLVARADSNSPYQMVRGTTLKRGGWIMKEKGNEEIRLQSFTPLTGTQERSYSITLITGENTISVSAFNETNLVMSVPHSIKIKAEIPERRPELFVLSIGNDHFANALYNLANAIKDSRDFSDTVQKLASPHYAKVHTQVLNNTTKRTIMDAITAMAARMHPEDTFIFFSASHGWADDRLYYLYTAEFEGDEDKRNPRHYISSVELMEFLKRIPALKQVVVLDTCHSGALQWLIAGLYDATVSPLARALGVHIFSGAKSYQEAQDAYKGNGLFTYFVLSGLKGQADANKNREVTVFELSPYLIKSVKEAIWKGQEPVVRHFGEDLPLTRSAGRTSP